MLVDAALVWLGVIWRDAENAVDAFGVDYGNFCGYEVGAVAADAEYERHTSSHLFDDEIPHVLLLLDGKCGWLAGGAAYHDVVDAAADDVFKQFF